MMGRAVLTVLMWGVTLATGLSTAWLQNRNFVRASELDELKRRYDVLQAEIDQKRAFAEARENALRDLGAAEETEPSSTAPDAGSH